MASTRPSSLHVLIAGAGVTGLETLMALRALAGPRVSVTLLSPHTEFVYKPNLVREPFASGHATRLPLDRIAADFGAELRQEKLAWVAPGAHSAFTESGAEIGYDVLVLALGARRQRPWDQVITFAGGEDSEAVQGLIRDIEGGYSRSVAFIVPPGTTWPLPLYELALMTAARARDMGVTPELTLITPEASPLQVFGHEASDEVAGLLAADGIAVRTFERAEVSQGRSVALQSSRDVLTVDRVVTVPILHGTAPRGIPADSLGFIPTDGHGRVDGIDDVYAAGDGIQFAVKSGGIGTQQADAVAEVVAKLAGASLEPRAFHPVVRSILFTGDDDHFLSGEIGHRRDAVSQATDRPLWWPPAKIAGRYLSPYLASIEPDVSARDTAA